jgi:hypothetical protein
MSMVPMFDVDPLLTATGDTAADSELLPSCCAITE